MLDMGFIPDIERIFKLTPPRRQTLFFSATMPPEITRLTTAFLKDPTRIEVSRPAQTADTITQYLVRIPTSDPKAKRTALRALIERSDVKNGIVFCNRKSEVDIVAKSLKTHGFDAAPIHGDLDQSHRMKTLADFRSGALKILVASDVAARGLDIPDVSHVFNYDVSHHADDYVHRIGRTGRAGRLGQAFMIVTPADDKSLDKVLKLIKKEPEELVLDGVDFDTTKKPAQRDDKGGRERTGRGGTRSTDKTEQAVAASAEIPTEAQTAEAPARSRSRRKTKPEAAPPPAVEATLSEPVSVDSDRPARAELEPQLRQSDRRGERRPEERERTGVKGFGDDIPAFLRRPVIIHG
jgi:superfamily II DNA/RNA helicase